MNPELRLSINLELLTFLLIAVASMPCLTPVTGYVPKPSLSFSSLLTSWTSGKVDNCCNSAVCVNAVKLGTLFTNYADCCAVCNQGVGCTPALTSKDSIEVPNNNEKEPGVGMFDYTLNSCSTLTFFCSAYICVIGKSAAI